MIWNIPAYIIIRMLLMSSWEVLMLDEKAWVVNGVLICPNDVYQSLRYHFVQARPSSCTVNWSKHVFIDLSLSTRAQSCLGAHRCILLHWKPLNSIICHDQGKWNSLVAVERNITSSTSHQQGPLFRQKKNLKFISNSYTMHYLFCLRFWTWN